VDAAGFEIWQRGRGPVWHIVERDMSQQGDGLPSMQAISLCERHQFNAEMTTKYHPWTHDGLPARICKRCSATLDQPEGE
jgi:hypothetical protein